MLRGLHKLCDSGDWEGANAALADTKNRQSCSRVHGRDDWTPLHLACKHNAPIDLVSALIKAGPGATEHLDAQERLPMHYAAEHGAPLSVLTALWAANPLSLCKVDRDGRTPLHLKIAASQMDFNSEELKKPPSREEIEILVDDKGAVLSMVDSDGDLPLHCACRNIDKYSVEVLRLLVRSFVPSLLEVDASGQTPLHLAFMTSEESSLSLDKLNILMVIEDVVHVQDNQGRLPLHCACMNLPIFEVIEVLVNAYPDSVAHHSNDGSYPLDNIEDERNTTLSEIESEELNKISDMIFVHYPHIEPYNTETERIQRLEICICREINQFQSLGSTASLAWKWMCQMCGDPENIYSTTMLDITKSLSHSMVVTLCNMKTSEGEIMDISSPTCKDLLHARIRFAGRYEFELEQYTGICNDTSYTTLAKEYFVDEDQNKERCEKQRNVVIKLFLNRESYDREVDLHSRIMKNNGYDSSVLPIVNSYDIDRVGTDREVSGDCEFHRDILDKETYKLGRYRYALILPQSGPELETRLATEFYDMSKIKKHIRGIGHVIQVLHLNGLSLGEITGKSFVTFNDGLLLPELTKVKVSEKEYYGTDFRSGMLPPEMIATLDSDGVDKYEVYWKPVIDDAKVVKLLLPDDVQMISDKVDSFLQTDEEKGVEARFACLWDRITRNSHLWKRIIPQTYDDMHCVVKCCQIDEITNFSHMSNKLPYDLIPASVSVDIWCFGAFIYELCSGEPLFPRHLTRGDDYRRIATWDIDSEYATMKMERVDDPLARDLLKKLLRNQEGRPTLLEYILDHPYFSAPYTGDRNIREMSHDIMKSEEFLVCHKKWVKSHTIQLSTISSGLLSRLENSTWSQWRKICNNVEEKSIFPTSFVILPYELTTSPCGKVEILKEKGGLASKFALLLAKIIQNMMLVEDLGRKFDQKLSKYAKPNRVVLPECEDNAVDICGNIVARENHAKKSMHDILNGMVMYPSSVAESIVDNIIEQVVDIKLCRDIVSKVNHAKKVYSEDIEYNPFEKETLLKGVKSKCELLLGSEFCSKSASYKEEVDAALSGLIQAFSADPQGSMMGLLENSMNEFLHFLFSCGKLHFYLIDEMTWTPLISENYQRNLVPSVELLEVLLPCMYVCIKAMCSTGVHLDLSSMLGVPDSQGLSLKQGQCVRRSNTVFSFKIFYKGMTNCFSSEYRKDDECPSNSAVEIFEKYKHILHSLDSEKKYAHMKRIYSPDGLTLWTLGEGDFDIKQEDEDHLNIHDLNRYEREKCYSSEKNMECQTRHSMESTYASKAINSLNSMSGYRIDEALKVKSGVGCQPRLSMDSCPVVISNVSEVDEILQFDSKEATGDAVKEGGEFLLGSYSFSSESKTSLIKLKADLELSKMKLDKVKCDQENVSKVSESPSSKLKSGVTDVTKISSRKTRATDSAEYFFRLGSRPSYNWREKINETNGLKKSCSANDTAEYQTVTMIHRKSMDIAQDESYFSRPEGKCCHLETSSEISAKNNLEDRRQDQYPSETLGSTHHAENLMPTSDGNNRPYVACLKHLTENIHDHLSSTVPETEFMCHGDADMTLGDRQSENQPPSIGNEEAIIVTESNNGNIVKITPAVLLTERREDKHFQRRPVVRSRHVQPNSCSERASSLQDTISLGRRPTFRSPHIKPKHTFLIEQPQSKVAPDYLNSTNVSIQERPSLTFRNFKPKPSPYQDSSSQGISLRGYQHPKHDAHIEHPSSLRNTSDSPSSTSEPENINVNANAESIKSDNYKLTQGCFPSTPVSHYEMNGAVRAVPFVRSENAKPVSLGKRAPSFDQSPSTGMVSSPQVSLKKHHSSFMEQQDASSAPIRDQSPLPSILDNAPPLPGSLRPITRGSFSAPMRSSSPTPSRGRNILPSSGSLRRTRHDSSPGPRRAQSPSTSRFSRREPSPLRVIPKGKSSERRRKVRNGTSSRLATNKGTMALRKMADDIDVLRDPIDENKTPNFFH